MAALARAEWPELEACWRRETPKPLYDVLREPETGMVMLRGRMGGTGSPFNFGEATVTRCSVCLQDGPTGHAYVMGRSRAHAEVAAVFDAMMQMPQHAERLGRTVIDPLRQADRERRQAAASRSAATRVEFFTLVRGED